MKRKSTFLFSCKIEPVMKMDIILYKALGKASFIYIGLFIIKNLLYFVLSIVLFFIICIVEFVHFVQYFIDKYPVMIQEKNKRIHQKLKEFLKKITE